MIVERLDPDATGDAHNRALHLERYRWAQGWVEGGEVLDIACGVGYGSAMLAKAPSGPSVLGVDRAEEAIATARQRYGGARVRFQQADAESFAPEYRFDTIVCLETLEHLQHPVAFLRHMHAALRPGGRLVVSAPTREKPGDNPYHVHCFTEATFTALVSEGFEVEEARSQVGAYLTVAARRREQPALAWQNADQEGARATIGLVTWNSQQNVLDLLGAIRAFSTPPYRLVVVDNDSTDGTRSMLRLLQGEPGYRLLENAENAKCARATNQIVDTLDTDYLIYLCASHALVTDVGWNDALVGFLETEPDVGIAGDVWAPGFTVKSRFYAEGWDPAGVPRSELLHVQGGAWIARRSLFERWGRFDEVSHPHAGMDVELSYRLLSHGQRLGRCPLITCPPSPRIPEREEGVSVYHPASPALRAEVRRQLGWAAASPPPAVPTGWRHTRGRVETREAGALHVAGQAPDSGLLSECAYRDVRVQARVSWRGILNVKLRVASAHDASADGYHVLLGGRTNYLARAGHVLARFAPPQGPCRLAFEARGRTLRVAIDGRELARVHDDLLEQGPVFVGVNEGEATFADLRVEELSSVAAADGRPPIVVFCELLDNESFCASVVRELRTFYDVRPCGPGWPAERLADVDTSGARFYLELDAASGRFCRPEGLERLDLPKYAWLIDIHKKPLFHQALARQMRLTFFAMKTWGHVLDGPAAWLPLHCDTTIFGQVEAERDLDIVFVGSQPWRADAIRRIAEKHGLRVHVACTTGPKEKSETAALYARAKLVYNRHVTNDLNFRVFEALACGRVLLTDAQLNGQYELLEDGRHYVLYKDDRDLEALILRYLGDDQARARIEREAAQHARAHHSTRARIRQLREAIEADLTTIEAPAAPVTAPATTSTPLRWLFFVGDAPPSVAQKGYAEEIAWALAGRGHSVTIARPRRCVLPIPEPRDGEPRIVEIDSGPVSSPPSKTNRELAAAGPQHAACARIAAQYGPFDVAVGDGAFGGLALQPLAAREELPLLLVLEHCEVERRQNRLTREQLYTAELEHWLVDRAALVITPAGQVAEVVRRHYGATATHVAAIGNVDAPPVPGAERLLSVLGVPNPFALAISDLQQPDEVLQKLEAAASTDHAIVACAGSIWSKAPSSEARLLAKGTASGVVLAGLAQMSRRTLRSPQYTGITQVAPSPAGVSDVRYRQQQSDDARMQLRVHSLSSRISGDVVRSLEKAVAELAARKVAGGLARVVH